ncbi:hypothetical protein F9U64_21545 [Gracilibacillus oryzae]|uniref:Uncharacterized protein n=1 Tax=Gracilibacillus oryzae TaxID=1672701 RepID=A0A7C8KVK0_9BACI|nr:hypothetical protein [Gracilibacillus oryzae]KAB8125841.1 hypothetical protein F9U64_21545 [Gracilibacillus oryzae]
MKKILWSSIVLIILSWAGNYLYYQSKQLDAPIFLTHYYEADNHENLQFTFFYLTNKSNPVDVQYAEVAGMELYPVSSQGFTVWHGDMPQVQYEQAYRHHYLRSVTLKFPAMEMAFIDEQNEALSFSSMDVYFSDQTSLTADIGEVMIQPLQQGRDILHSTASGGSTNGRSFTSMTAEQALTITDISFPFDKVTDQVEVKIDHRSVREEQWNPSISSGSSNPLDGDWEHAPGKMIADNDLFPMSIAKNDSVRLLNYLNPDRRSYFEFGIYLNGITEDGKPFSAAARIIDRPYLDQAEVNEIIEERQES